MADALPDEIQAMMDLADQKEDLTEGNIVTFVNSLKEKTALNLQLRYQHGDDPIKFLDAEMKLHDAVKQLKEVPVAPAVLKAFLAKTDGMPQLLGLLAHKNPDIVLDVLNTLSDLTDPELLMPLAAEEEIDVGAIVKDLLDRDILSYLVDLLQTYGPTQHENDDGFQIVTLVLQLIENFLELDGEALLVEVRCNSLLVPWFLNAILHKEKQTYNKLYAMEILEAMMQQSAAISQWVSLPAEDTCDLPEEKMSQYGSITKLTKGLGGVRNFINALAIYRKQDIDDAEAEEFVSNCYLCLELALLSPAAVKVFSEHQGVPLMIRMIRAKNKCIVQALSTLAVILDGRPSNCDLFISSGGLKGLGGVLMYKGVVTKNKGKDYRVDELVCEILLHCLSHCTPENQSRVCLKLAENRGEKMTRLWEIILTYHTRVATAETQVQKEIEALKKIQDIGEEVSDDEEDLSYDDRLWLRKSDLGYGALLNAIRVLLNVATEGSNLVQKLMIGLQCQQNVHPLKIVGFYVEDYLSHVADTESTPEAESLRALLSEYLRAYDALLKSEYLAAYAKVRDENVKKSVESEGLKKDADIREDDDLDL